MKILMICPEEDNKPFGGVRKQYRHVDILNANGIPAAIFHQQEGFRCTWFENKTRVVHPSCLGEFNPPSFLVIPEVYGSKILEMGQGVKKIIFNQNCYYTFRDLFLKESNPLPPCPYLHPDVLATLVVSNDSLEYLQHTFPKHPVFRIHNSINTSVFSFQPKKKKQIAFMPRKQKKDVMQVFNILKYHGVFKEYEPVIIEDKTEVEVAAILKESLIFMSFGHPEGFSLPPAEAMACGCIVVGYHGMAGKEYFKEEFCYPVQFGDIVGYCQKVEEVIRLHKTQPELLADKAKKASTFIRDNYSEQREEEDIVSFWKGMVPFAK